MGEIKASLPQRELHLLEGLLRIPSGSVQATLSHTSDLVAGATGADTIDAFLYDQLRDCLVAVGTVMLATPEHPVSVTLEQGQKIEIAADPARLRQCLENIIANAIQKSPKHAAVSVFVTLQKNRPDGPLADVTVIDQGPGISEELLPHVFERFVSGKQRQGGLGLGLYLAKRIAGMHGGDLTVDSAPGKGARFVLTLPLAAGSAAAPQAAPSASPRE